MAARKAKAKTKAAAKKAPAKRSKKGVAHAVLPEGFQAIGGFAQSWEYEKEPLLVGTITGFREVTVKRGRKEEPVNTCTIEREDGTLVTVWESATLRGLFEQCEEGQMVAIAYQGIGKAKKGQNPPKLFAVGVAE